MYNLLAECFTNVIYLSLIQILGDWQYCYRFAGEETESERLNNFSMVVFY